jgi:hypothetical protein
LTFDLDFSSDAKKDTLSPKRRKAGGRYRAGP